MTRPPTQLFATEDVSPRYIDLTWTAPSFGVIDRYNIYRQPPFDTGSPLTVQASSLTFNSATNQYTYVDKTAACNPGGYTYAVSALLQGTDQESAQSNSVNTTTAGKPLTGCYTNTPPTVTLNDLSFGLPNPTVQGSIVTITWTLRDDDTGTFVPNLNANTLVANGPVFSNNCSTVTQGSTNLLVNGVAQTVGGSPAGTFVQNGNQFTFAWDTDAFCAGSYTFTLNLDSKQSETTASALQLQIDINDTDSTPHVTTLSVPDATVDVNYNNLLSEHGGVGSVSWGLSSGSLPPNITLSSGGTLSGIPIVPPPGQLNFLSQPYNFTVQVTDSATPTANVGTEAFTLRLITPVSFKATPYSTGMSPIGVITADFNGDGKPDLAIANSGDNTVSILLNNGDGTFTAQPTLVAGSVPYSLAAGDFDHDGNMDLVVTNFANGSASTVSVFLGTGGGNFQPPVTYAVGAGPISVVTGDFNKDGKLDLAVANQNGAIVSILLGDGLGAFQQPNPPYPAGTTDAAGVVTGDFDGDGNLDLAITNPSDDTVSVLLGNGDGTFKAPVSYSTGPTGNHPVAVSAVDLNGDNKLDLAVTNLDANTVAILLGKGDGTFKASVPYPTTNGASFGPAAMTTGDFNGDGKVDLAITEQSNNRVSILLGNGDIGGTFQSPLEFTTGNNATGVAAGDFNSDGRLDLAVANHDDNTVSVMLHLPQPPTTLAVTNVASGQVTLGWSASTTTPTIAGYNVYQATTSGGPYTKLNGAPVPAGTLTYTDSAVASATTYYYVVTAVDAGNLESVTSNEVSATTP